MEEMHRAKDWGGDWWWPRMPLPPSGTPPSQKIPKHYCLSIFTEITLHRQS